MINLLIPFFAKEAVPAKLFGDIISKLKDDISFVLPEGKSAAKITSGKSKYEISVQDPADFPNLPEVSEEQTIVKLPSLTLVEGFKNTLFAVSPDETKQILTGVNLKLSSEAIKFAATDGHRCTVYEAGRHQEENSLPINSDSGIVDITVSAPTCQELMKAMAKCTESDTVEIVFNPSYIAATYENYKIVARKLEGQYPKVENLFPSGYKKRIEVDRKALIAAMQRIAVIADQKNHIIKMTIDGNFPDELYFSVKETEMGTGQEVVTAKIESDTDFFTFALNVKYVLAGLSAMSAEFIEILIEGEIKPVIVKPLNEVNAMKYLVMPVQLR